MTKLAAVDKLLECLCKVMLTLVDDNGKHQLQTALDAYTSVTTPPERQSIAKSTMRVNVAERIELYLQVHGCSEVRKMYRFLHLMVDEMNAAVNAMVVEGIMTIERSRPNVVHYTKTCACVIE